MSNRSLLHRSKLEEFKQWLADNGWKIEKPNGGYEVLRWKGETRQPKPIIYDRHDGDHYTANDAAVPYVYQFIKTRSK